MKRVFIFILLILLILPACADEVTHEVLYFYSNYCEQCDPAGEFAEQFEQLTGYPMDKCTYSAYNVVKQSGQAALEAAKTRYGITEATFPMVIVDGQAYFGAGQMNTLLAETALTWPETNDSIIVYLYVPACESCESVSDTLDALPESVTVTRGSITFESKVIVDRIDVSAAPDTVQSLFDAYEVPDEDRVTPIVFFGSHYISGSVAINEKLCRMVELGWAAGGIRNVQASEDNVSSGFTVWSAAAAGLAAGLNTCALSMLLLFVSVLMEAKKRAGLLAACFLVSKFTCYLLIGFVFLSALQQFNPTWLKPAARILMTIVGAVLIALNLWDAYQSRQGEFGKVRNQLPRRLRGGLRGIIRKLLDTRFLVPAVIALGFIVAAGEFLCAGQLYLMQLLELAGTGNTARKLELVVYCAAFILPGIVLCAVTVHANKITGASVFLSGHMFIFKLITAVVMLIMICAAWLI